MDLDAQVVIAIKGTEDSRFFCKGCCVVTKGRSGS